LVDFSPRAKFIAITVDELILVPIAIILVYYFLPELLIPITILLIIGAVIFVAGKYYLIYPSLQESSVEFYELKGLRGKVINTVTPEAGKIKVGAEIWDARCDVGEIEVGTEIVIIERDRMRVRVEPYGMRND
jgi:membrane protein implicated in regulation of membrane protease activity